MKYMMIITYTDLADERPRVVVHLIEAASEEEIRRHADELAASASKLMDLSVSDWRKDDEWKDLEGEALLKKAGYAFGIVEVWSGEQFVHLAETPFGPYDLRPVLGNQPALDVST